MSQYTVWTESTEVTAKRQGGFYVLFFFFMQAHISTFLCTLPPVPLLYFPRCSLLTHCRLLSFTKHNKCLCLLSGLSEHSEQGVDREGMHCPSLLTFARQRTV